MTGTSQLYSGLDPAAALTVLPPKMRDELLGAYQAIFRNYRERRWEPSELNGGKFCECVYSILRGLVDGRIPPSASKPRNMVDACRGLENAGASFPHSVRILIPRVLVALYDVRNNRGVGHVGGDIDPNHMDALCVLAMAKWTLAELIRVLHNIDIDTATVTVEALTAKNVELVWAVGSSYRVLVPSLSMRDKVLLLLYHHHPQAVTDRQLFTWTEHSRIGNFRRDVLVPLHKAKYIEFDAATGDCLLSPVGVRDVEERLIATVGS